MTLGLEGRCSIQLSYGRNKNGRVLALLFSLLVTLKPLEPVPVIGLEVSTPVSKTVHELSPCS